ncbi:MAG: hypothetical protein ACHQU8_03535 [Gemmatimonadales bacterium]
MRKRVLIAGAAALVLAWAALLAWRGSANAKPRRRVPTARAIRVLPPDSMIAGPVLEEHRIGAYLIRLIADSAARERIVDIKQNNHRVFAARAADARLEFVGKDVTGDHVPDVVVQAFSGGMHCCTQATILSLGTRLTTVATIEGADGDVEFDDVDGDGIPEVKVGDWRFAYWREYAFVETQVPEVILRYDHGVYRPACDLMKEPPPDRAALERRARRLTDGWTSGDPPAEFYGYILDLIYGGNADLAWRWVDRAWPSGVGGKNEFLADLKDRLQGSACWSPPPPEHPTT